MSSAIGIPNRAVYGDVSKLKPGDILNLYVQEHEAERAGKHYDVRIDVPGYGLLSWATRKGIPEEPGIKRLLIEQPLHSSEYAEFEGEIESGYGKGKVRKVGETPILITGVEPNIIKFVLIGGKDPQRFVMVRSKDKKKWYMMNVATADYPEDYEKPKFKAIDAAEIKKYIDKIQVGDSIQEKIDGAHGIIRLFKENAEILSVRKRKTGEPIVHTERVFGPKIKKLDIPPELHDSLLIGEIYGVRKGEAIPPQELGAILNSLIYRAIQKKKEQDITLRVALFDVLRAGKEDVTGKPYSERFKILEERILPRLPSDVFEMIKQETDPRKAQKFWEDILAGRNPRTEEGVVLRLQSEDKPVKVKAYSELDVYIRRFFPGEGKYKDVGVGGFYYSLGPDGAIVGKVGTGFTDEMRRLMKEKPEEFLGRVARVKFQEQYPSKALRMPVFISVHEDRP